MGGPVLALFVLVPMRRWRRFWKGRLGMLVGGLVLLAASVSLTACGGGFKLPATSQTYTLTITGSGGSDVHTTTVQLTVQQ
jgi:hypothetical protein